MNKSKRRTVIIIVVIVILLAISYSKFLKEEKAEPNQGASEGPTVSDVLLGSQDVDTYCDPFWNTVFEFPTEEDIAQYNKDNQKRAPYICGWLQKPEDTKYTEYMIDFRADCVANGTYISLANWYMDYSALEEKYESVEMDGVAGYAGFQKISNGQMYSIMSFWDVFCKDKEGNRVTVRAKRVFPETTGSKEEFDGEGTGAHHSDPYVWESDHWYRMHLKCSTSNETGNTLVEQGVWDLETDTYTTLCIYDVGVPNATFKGAIGVFLENYDARYAGQVRTIEICNAKYLDATTNQWNDLKQIYISSQQPGAEQTLLYSGSYNFGVTENRVWMITSGVGGDWHNNGTGKQGDYFSVE